jgi:hypothetical protein
MTTGFGNGVHLFADAWRLKLMMHQRQLSGSPSEVPPEESLVARARVGTKKGRCRFDTGAQVTTMSPAFYKKSGCPDLLFRKWC